MRKRYQHIDLPPELQEFWKNFLAATEVEDTLFGIITCYKMYGQYFMRSKSSLTGKRVKQDKRFQRTMHNAGVMALASKYVTPVYNNLSEDWRCQDLQRKLVGIGVKLLHQGEGKEVVQQAVWEEVVRLGYRTEWPVWQMPPELAKWVKEEESARKDSFGGAECDTTDVEHEKPVRVWVVNEKGQLAFVGQTSNEYYLSDPAISSTVKIKNTWELKPAPKRKKGENNILSITKSLSNVFGFIEYSKPAIRQLSS